MEGAGAGTLVRYSRARGGNPREWEGMKEPKLNLCASIGLEVTILFDWCNLSPFRPVLKRVVPIYNARSENPQFSLCDKFSSMMNYEVDFDKNAPSEYRPTGNSTNEKRRRLRYEWVMHRMGDDEKTGNNLRLFKSYAQWKDIKVCVKAVVAAKAWEDVKQFSNYVANSPDPGKVDHQLILSASIAALT